MKNEIKLIKHFAISDALLKGTALSSNLILISIIATIPEFGIKGILTNAFLQLTITGLLEIPTGKFADRFGWNKSVKIGLILKFFTTALFALAVLAVINGHVTLGWMLITFESVIDSFATSFINGAYSSAYNKWYFDSLSFEAINHKTTPPLFVTSFKYAIKIRYFLPFLAILLGSIGFYNQLIDPNFVFAGLLLYIFALRFIVYFRITGDLKNTENSDKSLQSSESPTIKDTLTIMPAQLVLYGVSTLLSLGTNFYLHGEIYKYLKLDETALGNTWLKGTIIGLAINLTSVFASRHFSAKLSKNSSQFIFLISPIIALIFTTITFLLGFVEDSSKINIFVLILYSVFSITFGQLVQGWLMSNILHLIPARVRATWVSLGEVIGLMFFSIISAAVLIQENSIKSESAYLLGVLIVILSSYILIIFNKKQLFVSKILLKNYLSKAIIGATVAFFVLFGFFDLVSYKLRTTSLKEESDSIILNALTASLIEPVKQGSYTEILDRIRTIQSKNSDICASIRINDGYLGECEFFLKKKYLKTKTNQIYFDEKQEKVAAVVYLYSDFEGVNTSVFYKLLLNFFLYSLMAYVLFKLILQASKNIIKEVDSLKSGHVTETDFVIQEFFSLSKELVSYSSLKEKAAAEEAASKIASQVSHDIRSPLSALEMISLQLSELPEDKRLIIRNSINRIRDIANALSMRKISSTSSNNNVSFEAEEPTNTMETILVLPLLDVLTTEKRLEHRDKLNLSIEFNQSIESYGLFAKINQIEFMRMISNLVNNAIDSLPNHIGRVSIELSYTKNNLILKITDNGKGIPAKIIPELGKRGMTFEKESGSGLGLHHAFETVRHLGGELSINSLIGQGTTVKVILPIERPPSWFVSKLKLKSNLKIVILDDDQSIHQIWDGRFDTFLKSDRSITVEHFSTVDQLRSFYRLSYFDLDDVLFLVDYELNVDTTSGLDVIEQLGIQSQSILVTSRFEERLIRERCDSLGVKLIPKNMSGFVPIEIE